MVVTPQAYDMSLILMGNLLVETLSKAGMQSRCLNLAARANPVLTGRQPPPAHSGAYPWAQLGIDDFSPERCTTVQAAQCNPSACSDPLVVCFPPLVDRTGNRFAAA